MKRFLLALLFLSTPAFAQATAPVSAPGPAPHFPPPGFTPMGAGASHGSLAAPGRPAVERSPNKRLVPASNEPGVWAADGDPALKATLEPPKIGNVELPFPDDAQEPEDFRATFTCAGSMTQAMNNARQHVRYFNQPDALQLCLAAKMYKACADALLWQMKAEHATGSRSAEDVRRHQSTAWKAQAFMSKLCAGLTLDQSQNDILNATVMQWKTVIRNSPPPTTRP